MSAPRAIAETSLNSQSVSRSAGHRPRDRDSRRAFVSDDGLREEELAGEALGGDAGAGLGAELGVGGVALELERGVVRYTLAVGDGRRRGGVVVVAVGVGVVPGDGSSRGVSSAVRGAVRGGWRPFRRARSSSGRRASPFLKAPFFVPPAATRRDAARAGTRARTDPSSAGNPLLETRRASTTRSARLAGDAAGAPTRQNMELGEMLNARATHRRVRESARASARATRPHARLHEPAAAVRRARRGAPRSPRELETDARGPVRETRSRAAIAPRRG